MDEHAPPEDSVQNQGSASSWQKGALYSTLIRLSNSYGVERSDGILINIVLTNQDLAKFCAAARESVNRMLGDLRKKGLFR